MSPDNERFLSGMMLILAGLTQLLATWNALREGKECDGVKLSFYSLPWTAGSGSLLFFSTLFFAESYGPLQNIPATPLSVILFVLGWSASIVFSEGALRIVVQIFAPQIHFWKVVHDPAEDSVS